MLNELYDNYGSRKKSKRVGRGLGSGKGKTCGSGYKGQKSRTGVAINGFEGGQMPIYMRLPKRGFNNIFRVEHQTFNLDRLNIALEKHKVKKTETITKEMLKSFGLITNIDLPVKILGNGSITVAIIIEADHCSKSAYEAIHNAGGTILGVVKL